MNEVTLSRADYDRMVQEINKHQSLLNHGSVLVRQVALFSSYTNRDNNKYSAIDLKDLPYEVDESLADLVKVNNKLIKHVAFIEDKIKKSNELIVTLKAAVNERPVSSLPWVLLGLLVGVCILKTIL